MTDGQRLSKSFDQNTSKSRLKLPCTSCGKDIICGKDARRHPVLGTLQCVTCNANYQLLGDLSKYRNGVDLNGQCNYCIWCLDGGELVLCGDDNCRSGFCYTCIQRNLGHKLFEEIRDSSKWFCLMCDESQLTKLRSLASKLQPDIVVSKVGASPAVTPAPVHNNSTVIPAPVVVPTPAPGITEPAPAKSTTASVSVPTPSPAISTAVAISTPSPAITAPVAITTLAPVITTTAISISSTSTSTTASNNSSKAIITSTTASSAQVTVTTVNKPAAPAPAPAAGKLPKSFGLFSSSRLCSRPEKQPELVIEKSQLREPSQKAATANESVVKEPLSKDTTIKEPPSRESADKEPLPKEIAVKESSNKALMGDETNADETKVEAAPMDVDDVSMDLGDIPMNLEDELYFSDDSDEYDTPVESPDKSLNLPQNGVTSANTSATSNMTITSKKSPQKRPADGNIVTWAVKDAAFLNKKLKNFTADLVKVSELFNKSSFEQNSENLENWLSILETSMKTSSFIEYSRELISDMLKSKEK